MKFGKKSAEFDERTISLSKYMDRDFHAPSRFDFDQNRAPIPISDWGSLNYKSDVIAAQANQLLRFGRIDERRTIPLTNQDVLRRYRRLSGSKKRDDENDTGLTMLQAFRDWHQYGWRMRDKVYRIALYGEIESRDRELLRTAVYVFRGVHFGFWLPSSVEIERKRWDWKGENGPNWKAGSLGGVVGYCKAYTPYHYEVIVGGDKIAVSNEFVEKYCDECWAAVESIDYWGKQVLDMRSLLVVRPSLAQHFNMPEGG
jgi:hypothetical protein